MNIHIDSIGYIEVKKPDKSYRIQSKDSVENIVNKLNSSRIEYIKFGSPNTFTLYDSNSKVILKAFFRDTYFKINGVVYKAESNLFN